MDESTSKLAQELGSKPKVLAGDVKDMAWVWEEAISHIRQASARDAFFSLRAITRSYLRGRGLRMGNWQGLKKHGFVQTCLMTCIAAYVIREGATIFEALHQAGLTSVESFFDRFVQETKKLEGEEVLDEVRRMLDGN